MDIGITRVSSSRAGDNWEILFLCWRILILAFISEQCREPLGMESGRILDRDITASSAYDAASVGPHHAR